MWNKTFAGSSTGNLLVDKEKDRKSFEHASKVLRFIQGRGNKKRKKLIKRAMY